MGQWFSGLPANQPATENSWLAAPFEWRWPFRYLLAAAALAGSVALAVYAPPLKPQWLILVPAGALAIWGLFVAREFGVLLLACAGLAVVWYFAKDFEQATWWVIMAIGALAYVGHQIDQAERKMQRQIDAMRSQLFELRGEM